MADTPLLENRVCFAMYSATNAMVRQYRPRLQVYDLTYPQFIVLLALYEQDNVTLTEIGQKTFFDSGTLTPIIKKLEEKQFLKRVAVKEDERMKKVYGFGTTWAKTLILHKENSAMGRAIHVLIVDEELGF